MAFLSIPNVAIKGMSACVPSCIEENKDVPLYTPEEAEKVIETTGVERKHIVTDSQTASDLCFRACEELLEKLSWDRDSIDLICNVTYHRYLYGQDREGRPLFGDCGTATALEYDESASPMYFQTGTNSKDGEALIRKKGGFRQPYTLEEYQQEIGMRSGELSTDGIEDLMDGMSVFSFGISTPPKSIKQLCEHFGLSLDKVDKLVLHQANKFMVQKIAKKLKVELDRVPFSLRDYGNTTSASIPLTIVSQCANDYSTSSMKTLACGFGTGLSWASVYFETSGVVCPEVVEI